MIVVWRMLVGWAVPWRQKMLRTNSRLRIVALVLSLALVALALPPFTPQAAAYSTFGGSWGGQPGPGGCCAHLVVNVAAAQQQADIDAWNNARAAWNSSTALLYFDPGSSQLYALDTNRPDAAWDGFTDNQPCLTCTYTTAYLYINFAYTQNYPPEKTQSVAAHELGHTAGLAHADGCVLMVGDSTTRWDTCRVNGPQQDDVNGINSIY